MGNAALDCRRTRVRRMESAQSWTRQSLAPEHREGVTITSIPIQIKPGDRLLRQSPNLGKSAGVSLGRNFDRRLVQQRRHEFIPLRHAGALFLHVVPAIIALRSRLEACGSAGGRGFATARACSQPLRPPGAGSTWPSQRTARTQLLRRSQLQRKSTIPT